MSEKQKQNEVSNSDLLTKEKLIGFIKGASDAVIGNKLASMDFFSILQNTHAHEKANLVFSSREMEIALAGYIFLDKNFNEKLDKFFVENYPNTLKNAMKLAFKYYLGNEIYDKAKKEHPHYQYLLNLIKEKPEFSAFYKICCSLKEEFDTKIVAVNETWQKIKGVNFEKSIMAVNILYLREFLPYFDKILEQYTDISISKCKETFL